MWSGQKHFSRLPAFSASSLDTESRAACVPKRFDLTKRQEDTRIFFSLQYFSMSVGEHSGAIPRRKNTDRGTWVDPRS